MSEMLSLFPSLVSSRDILVLGVGLLAGGCTVARAQGLAPSAAAAAVSPAPGVQDCPTGTFTDPDYGYAIKVPDGYRCEFKSPPLDGQAVTQHVRVVMHDLSRPMCAAAVAIIAEPDSSTLQGLAVQQMLANSFAEGRRQVDGSVLVESGSKLSRILPGGPPHYMARLWTGSHCDNDELMSIANSLVVLNGQ